MFYGFYKKLSVAMLFSLMGIIQCDAATLDGAFNEILDGNSKYYKKYSEPFYYSLKVGCNALGSAMVANSLALDATDTSGVDLPPDSEFNLRRFQSWIGGIGAVLIGFSSVVDSHMNSETLSYAKTLTLRNQYRKVDKLRFDEYRGGVGGARLLFGLASVVLGGSFVYDQSHAMFSDNKKLCM